MTFWQLPLIQKQVIAEVTASTANLQVKEVIKEVQCVADYAHKFNQHIVPRSEADLMAAAS